jgi:hypothetical protein
MSHDIIQECCGKKFHVFHTFCHVHCLQIETSPKKFHKLKKEAVRFVGIVTLKLEFEFKFFYTLHKQNVLPHIKIC